MKNLRKSPRASWIDYDTGLFFVTICTKDKQPFFGKIINGKMYLSLIGEYLDAQLSNAEKYCDYVSILLYVVMPNHLHLIVACNGMRDIAEQSPNNQRNPNPAFRANPTCQRHVPTLSRYVSSLKGIVTKYAREIENNFGWQSRYHDHWIRNTNEGKRISEYIVNNPLNWETDCFYG